MDDHEKDFGGGAGEHMQDDLRQQVADVIVDRTPVLVWDTVAIFPFSGSEFLEPEHSNRIGELLPWNWRPSG